MSARPPRGRPLSTRDSALAQADARMTGDGGSKAWELALGDRASTLSLVSPHSAPHFGALRQGVARGGWGRKPWRLAGENRADSQSFACRRFP